MKRGVARRLVFLVLQLSALAAAAGEDVAARPGRSAADLMDAVMWQREPIGGPFRLVDAEGRPRRDTDFRGRLMLVYFGFMACPDICPTDLQQIGQALDMLGPQAREVAPLFVTLDPQRDTRAVIGAYAAAFHPQIIGLTGSERDVGRTADAYRVYHAKVAIPSALVYTIDHSSFVYLMGRDGKYLGFMPPGTSANRMVDILRPHLSPSAR